MSVQGARAYEYEYDYDYRYTSTAAPERKVEEIPVQKPKLEVHKNPHADHLESIQFWKDFAIKAVACVCACATLLLFTGISKAKRENANHKLEVANAALAKQQEANIMLNVELDAIVAGVDIDRVATEELGLVKVSSENEHYLVPFGENRVLFSAQEQ